MGVGGFEGPPKKKLKQAQLNFCVSTEKASNKRKLSDSSDGLAPKLFRRDPETPKAPVDKENLAVDPVDTSKDGVQAQAEKEVDIVALDDSMGGESGSDIPHDTVIEAVAKEGKRDIEVTDVSPGSENEGAADGKSGTETTNLKTAADTSDTLSLTNDIAQAAQDHKSGNSSSNGSPESTGSNVNISQMAIDEAEIADSVKPSAFTSADDNSESKLNKSTVSDQSDMVTCVALSSEDEQPINSPNCKTPPNRKSAATPRSSSKKAEREKQREERQRLKKEKEEQRRKEKEEKEKKKQEELRLKEEDKKRKEEERKRKEEERKRKDEERKRKDEERKRKEEERKKKEEAKEEERRKKEEEKKKKEEMKEEDRRKKEEARLAEERKENLAKAAFTKFFITEKTKPNLPKKDEVEAQSEKTDRAKFMPFPVKSDMRLAVQVRHTLTEGEKNVLTRALSSGEPVGNTYLEELKNGRKPMTSPATWPLNDEQHDVIIVEFVDDDKADVEQEMTSCSKSKGQKAKLLQFHENRRPPYWGTWRKPSKAVGPRRPFGQDKILDYEVDSDSEWEDEEEGEDIDKEDGDSEKEEADDENVGENGYMLDNTFVPHGYLSDEEAAEAEDDDSVEDQKLKLTVLKQEFDQELKSKTQRLQPRLLGCVYISNSTLEVSKSIYEPLMKLRCKWDDEPIDVTSPAVVECSPSPSVVNTKFPTSMVEKLAKLIHGNRSSMKALISEFLKSYDEDNKLSSISKRAVFLKIKEIAAKTFSSESGRLVWAVNPDLCTVFGLEPIADPPKMVPEVSPVVEPAKPKDSPLANFLKKTPQGPVKRISTTLVREGPSETASSRGLGAVHVDTPRPKFVPQVRILGNHPDKPIRRVSTTLLSSVAGPVKNKTFNVSEIDKPGQLVLSRQSKTMSEVGPTIDLSDSNDGIIPLPDESSESGPSVAASCKLESQPEGVSIDSTNPCVATSSMHCPVPDSENPMEASAKDAVDPADQPCQAVEPVSMETDVPTSREESPADAAKVRGLTKKDSGDPSTSDVKACPTETDEPPSTADAAPQTLKANTQPPKAPKSVSSNATPVRKRVPFVTLSKTVSKIKNAQPPGQKATIADMFCRKPAKKEVPSEPAALQSSAIVDLSADSN